MNLRSLFLFKITARVISLLIAYTIGSCQLIWGSGDL
jgi:lipoprotein